MHLRALPNLCHVAVSENLLVTHRAPATGPPRTLCC